MKIASCLLLLGSLLVPVGAAVVTYPAPQGETLSSDYEVRIGTNQVDVYTARVLDPPFAEKEWDYGGNYSFANFDLSGPVEVRITSKKPMGQTVVRPASAKITTRVEGDNS